MPLRRIRATYVCDGCERPFLLDPQPFPQPIPAAGAQGFWNWS